MVKNLSAMQDIQVWSLGWEDPLEKGMATHSSILAWWIPWTEDPGELYSPGSHKDLDKTKWDQSWVFIGRTDVEAETPILWQPHVKSWLIGKDSDAGRDWGQEEKGPTEDEMAGWHHWLKAHEFGWTLGVGDRQGGLVYCGSWGRKELDTTEQLKWTELKRLAHIIYNKI